MKRAIHLAFLAATAALTLPLAARAQEAGPPAADGLIRIYTFADLAQYGPQSALDMVQRIPGFNVNRQGGGGNRGFGQANENILVNGKRISGKSNDTADALSRIEASKVVRIEIVDGATLDVPGLSGEVANIIYKAGSTSGKYQWQGTVREIGLPDNWFKGSASLTGGGLNSNWTASLTNESSKRGNVGPETIVDAGGNLILVRDEISTNRTDQPRLAGSWSRTAANGDIFNINAAAQLFYYRSEQPGAVRLADGSRYDEFFENGEDEWNSELGVDYEFALGSGRLKLIGLQRNEHSEFFNRFGVVGQDFAGYDETVDENESVARAEYGLAALGGEMQLSLEGAYNRLAQESATLTLPASGGETVNPLPDTIIDEFRSEAILSYSRSLSNRLSMQINGGAEVSKIGFTRLNSQSRTYVRPKGSLALAWKARPWASVNLKADRIVDQLNFFRFLSAVDIQDESDRSSNSDIVPQQRWQLRAEAVLRSESWGSLTPYVEWQRIEDPLTFIPDNDGGESFGNLDTAATAWDYGANGTILFDKLGMDGVRFDLHAHWPGSRVVDPLLLFERGFDGGETLHYRLNLRHDVPRTNLAYGAQWNNGRQGPIYRRQQTLQYRNRGPRIDLFVEHKDIAGLNVRLDLYNIVENEQLFERVYYVDARGGPVSFIERFSRESGKVLDITVSGNF